VSERLILVERFEELREGMEVVDIDCDVCGKWCRSTIVSLVRADEVEQAEHGDCFECAPYCGDQSDGRFNGIDRSHVAANRIFAVLDGLESPAETAAASPGSETTKRTKETTDAHSDS
jgi:hypothetical protein